MHKLHFCTLFDANYLSRGLALYDSLTRHVESFELHVLAMCNETKEILSTLGLPNLSVISLTEFEDSELLKVKPSRTAVEYCWTVTPSLPLYLLKKNPSLSEITYVDADCYFFASPQPLFDELADKSVLIIEHRFSRDKTAQIHLSGRFNVGVLIFKNNKDSFRVLEDWRNQCIEWCFSSLEKGRFGDQVYLDEWPSKFPRVHILKHLGGGVAPWNIWNFKIWSFFGRPMVNTSPVIFFHFHQFKIFQNGGFDGARHYDRTKAHIRIFYQPYEKALRKSYVQISALFPTFNKGFSETLQIKRPISRVRKLWRNYRQRDEKYELFGL